MKPMDQKGISNERHCSCLGQQHFVPTLFHLEVGMVNQALESFKEWVDDIIVEIVPPVERDAEDAKEKSEISAEEKKQSYATKNIELRGKSGTATLIKVHLWQKNLGITQCEELSNMSGKLV
jgi:hypothetical protein